MTSESQRYGGAEDSTVILGAVVRSGNRDVMRKEALLDAWVVPTLSDSRAVLQNPELFVLPYNVSRHKVRTARRDDSAARKPGRQPLRPRDTARGAEVFAIELDRLTNSFLERVEGRFDAMEVMRRPVATSTAAALLPGLSVPLRDAIAAATLAWVDALAPVLSAPRPPRPWSRARRRERAAHTELLALLREGQEMVRPEEPDPESLSWARIDASMLAVQLAAGIQVPLAASSWLLVALAHSPELQDELSTELHHPDSAAHGLPAALAWETLRLFPPTWLLPRLAAAPTHLAGQHVAAGERVLVSPRLLGTDPSLIPGPDDGAGPLDEFDPHRWSSSTTSAPGQWLPFGTGPHACPGRNLGLAQLMAVARWAAHFELRLPDPIHIDVSVGLRPSPATLAFAAREDSARAATKNAKSSRSDLNFGTMVQHTAQPAP